MAQDDHVPVPGSERAPLAGATEEGAADPGEPLEVTVMVRRRGGAPDLGGSQPRVARADAAAALGADPEDLRRVAEFAAASGLRVGSSDPARRAVVLSGTSGAMAAAFGDALSRWRAADGSSFRGRTGPVHVPASLAAVVEGVFGLDDRPQSRPHFRRLAAAARDAGPAGPGFDPREVARLYNFPAGADGGGQTIAMLEFGGGFSVSDISAYFSQLGMAPPEVVAVGVDGAANRPGGGADSADGEVLLDIEVAGAAAPGARIAVYFAPNSERGFIDAMSAAVHDRANAPSVVSISWGGPELGWTRQGMAALDAVFQDAAALGITVCCASGDNGSGDGVGDGRAHTDFPASSPHALACGGTRLVEAAGRIASETVWNDGPRGGATGGGVSDVFALPPWQQGAGVPASVNPGGRVGRGVPDVGGDADPQTGYRILVDGQLGVVGGTSPVAPLWAALVARLNQALGTSVGLLNPALYLRAAPAGALHDIRSGDNGGYAAAPGWDACTGLGSPDGTAILRVLQTGAATSRP